MAPPIALFAYNRADHLRHTLTALAGNDGAERHPLILYCDGPRRDVDAIRVAEVREVARQEQQAGRFASVQVVVRTENLGLSRSIIAGVGEQAEQHGMVIVLEDDMVTSPHFLAFLRAGLALYAADEAVASIHAYVPPGIVGLPDTFFLHGADCWGWATWRRAWSRFSSDGKELLRTLCQRRLTHAFDLDGARRNTRLLRRQIAGSNDSWAIRWHASAFLTGMVTLHPGRTLVANIGLDGSGTHCGVDRDGSGSLSCEPVTICRREPAEDVDTRARFAAALRSRLSWRTRAGLLWDRCCEILPS